MDPRIDALARALASRAMESLHQSTIFTPGISSIPVTGKVFGEEEIYAATIASAEFWLTSGHFAEEFERNLARYVGMRGCLMVNSGSSANLLALSALTSSKLGERALKPGDEVITTPMTFASTVNSIILAGCKPVLVDINRNNLNIDYTSNFYKDLKDK